MGRSPGGIGGSGARIRAVKGGGTRSGNVRRIASVVPDGITPVATAMSTSLACDLGFHHKGVLMSTILFMPESAYGPTNNCIGIGDVLRRRGHRVVFAAEASWKGKLTALGFEEDLVDLAPPKDEEQDAGQFWKDFIRDTAPEFRKSTTAQLDTWIKPVWAELISGAKYCEPRLRDIIARTKPDVMGRENAVCF